MTLTLLILGHDFAYEIECVTRLFFAGAKINIVKCEHFTIFNGEIYDEKGGLVPRCEPLIVTLAEGISTDSLRLTVRIATESRGELQDIREIRAGDAALTERTLASMLFLLLSRQTGKRPPWGILTGIRPVRLCGQWSGEGQNTHEIKERFINGYLVLPEKAGLCIETYNAQKKILSMNKPGTFSLYVSIPFCPARCIYCSFVSHAIDKAAKLVPDYIRLLCEEIAYLGEYSKRKNLRLLSVYVGGGTPTSLKAPELKQILDAVNSSFYIRDLPEYTVEAGRPDTITAEKLEVMRICGADRISVNPQSMNGNVLKAIGRSHTAEQVIQCVALVKNAGFKNINMDLIAGLPGENVESFKSSLDKVISLSPDNITVHTLTVKRASHLRGETGAFSGANPDTAQMLGTAAKKIRAAGYFPYYLYRQKAAVENLENIGYSKSGHEGIYNIYSMEDRHNILAAGAGGVTKLIKGEHVKRIFNYKYPFEYISRFDEMIKRKTEEFK